MNQYRCETCKNYEDDEGKSACNIREEWISEDVWKWINAVGCASHSSYNPQAGRISKAAVAGAPPLAIHDKLIQQAEREKVLETFENLPTHGGCDWNLPKISLFVWRADLDKVLAELRQAGEP